MARIRAKFWVRSVEKLAAGPGLFQRNVVLHPVSKHGPNDPADNQEFWEATPSGEIKLVLTNKGGAAGELFEANIGTDCYVTFDFAPEGYHTCVTEVQWREEENPATGIRGKQGYIIHKRDCPEWTEGGTPLR